jgi:hypothetical protein
MTYSEALKKLNSQINNMPKYVSLFIAPKGIQLDKSNLKSHIGEENNKFALEQLGFINNDDLEVYATYQDGDRIYYPVISDYLQMLSMSKNK